MRLCSNHLAKRDPVLLGLCQKRQVFYMAKEELFRNKFLGGLFRMLGAFPVKRGTGGADALEDAYTLLEENGVCSYQDLANAASTYEFDYAFLQEIPYGSENRLEGYLFPDTYEFYAGEDPVYAINKMLANFERRMEDYFQQIADQGQTLREIVNVAAMIERETDGQDQTTIASVIYNRLNNNDGGTYGYLQIDATIQYALPEHKETLTDEDKAIDSPYNTYLYKGLPAGPISNPGLESIKAAMNPNSTSYYYYALGDDGVHHFFKTLREQQNFIATQELYNK